MVSIINLSAPIYTEMEAILRQFLTLDYEKAGEQFISFERNHTHRVDLRLLAAYFAILQRVVQANLNLWDQIHKDPFRARTTWISGVNLNFKRRIRRIARLFPIELIDRFDIAIRTSDLSPSMMAASLIGLAQGAALCNHFEKGLGLLQFALSLTPQISDFGDLTDIKDASCCGTIEWFSNQSISACLFSLEAAIIFLGWFENLDAEEQARSYTSNPQLMMERLMRHAFITLSECEIKKDRLSAEHLADAMCKLLKHNSKFDSRYYRWDQTNTSSFYGHLHHLSPLADSTMDPATRKHFLQQVLKVQQVLYRGNHANLLSLVEHLRALDGDSLDDPALLEMPTLPTPKVKYDETISFAPHSTEDSYESSTTLTIEEGRKLLKRLIKENWPYALANDGTTVSLEFRTGRRIRFCNIGIPTNFTATLTPEAVFSLIETINQLNGEACLDAFCPKYGGSCVVTAPLEL